MRNVIFVALLTVGFVGHAVAEEAKPAAKVKKEAVAWAAEDLKWADVPDTGGVQSAPLWGDMTKGAYGALFKFPAGKSMPLHTHSSDDKVVVIAGKFRYAPEGGAEKLYGPGSYLTTPKNVKHSSGCDAAAPCIFFMEQAGKFDMKVVGEPAAPKK